MASAGGGTGDTPAKRTKYDYLQDIVVLVGAKEQRFVVYKTIICDKSKFFQAACNGEWTESSNKTVHLPEVDPEIFAVYLGWLFTGDIDVSTEHKVEPGPKYKEDMLGGEYTRLSTRLIHSYALGDMLQDESFCNAIVDDMINLTESTHYFLCSRQVQEMWVKVPHSSTLVRLWVDYFATDCNLEYFNEHGPGLPHEFLLEVAKAGLRESISSADNKRPAVRGKCYYHKHEDGEDRCT